MNANNARRRLSEKQRRKRINDRHESLCLYLLGWAQQKHPRTIAIADNADARCLPGAHQDPRELRLVIDTPAGPLHVHPIDDWLACYFEDPIKAALVLDRDSRLNPYSGKWNWLLSMVDAYGDGPSIGDSLAPFYAAVTALWKQPAPTQEAIDAFKAEELKRRRRLPFGEAIYGKDGEDTAKVTP